MKTKTEDPVEEIVAAGLNQAGIPFERGKGNLDFYLTELGVYIECKQFWTQRIAAQMSFHENIIVIQGRHAAQVFAKIINN